MYKNLQIFICLALIKSGDSQPRRGRFGDPCQEDPNACMLDECWYTCGDTAKPKGMGSNVPVDPAGYSTFNSVSGRLGTISGGERNFLSGLLGTISGGKDNTGTGNLSAVGGGENNKAVGGESVISGGKNNIASGDGSVVPGGKCNTAGHKNSMAFGGIDSITGDCLADGAKSCNTDEDGQVKFCNPKSVFEGAVLVGNISISNKTIDGIGNMNIEDTIIIGTTDSLVENRTEITKDKIKSPEIETHTIRMRRPIRDNHRRLQDIALSYTTEITIDKMTSPKVETDNVDIKEAIVVGLSDDINSNKTEITKDKIKSPEIETRTIRMRRPIRDDGHSLQDIASNYTTEITIDKMTSPKVETDNVDIKEAIVIGLSDDINSNKTEITKDKIKSPEIETRAIRMRRPTRDVGRSLQDITSGYMTEITIDKMTSPKVETDNVDIKEAIVVGLSDDINSNKTEITKDKIKSPEIETRAIRMRPTRFNGRHLQDIVSSYTTIETNNIATESIIATNIQVDTINGISISLFVNLIISISIFNMIISIMLWFYILHQNKSRSNNMKDKLKISL